MISQNERKEAKINIGRFEFISNKFGDLVGNKRQFEPNFVTLGDTSDCRKSTNTSVMSSKVFAFVFRI